MVNIWSFLKKIFYFICLLIVSCTSLTGFVTPYIISEATLNRYLNKYANNHIEKFNFNGLADISLSFKSLQAQIAPGNSAANKIRLSGFAALVANSIIGTKHADIELTLLARPEYNAEQHAIYLKELELEQYDFRADNIRLNTATTSMLLPYLNQAITYYFDHNPVYILDTKNNSVETLVAKTAQSIRLEQGKIIVQAKK